MEDQALDQNLNEIKSLNYASFWDRTGATLIDVLIMIPVFALNYFNAMNWKSIPLALLISIVYIVYKIYMEGSSGGTLGKKAMKIKVVNLDGSKIDMQKSVQRNCLYLINSIFTLISVYMVYSAAGFENITGGFSELGKFQNENGFMLADISGILILISILFVIWEKQKQALHVKIAKTYCIKY